MQRESRLSRERRRREEKILNESQEERDCRLKLLSNSQAIRIQNESQEERNSRLEKLTKDQVFRLANESFEDRLDRLCLYSDNRDHVRRMGTAKSFHDSQQPGPAFPNQLTVSR